MNARDSRRLGALREKRRSAFEATVQEHYRPLYGLLWHLTRDTETAADLTQETFVEAWRSLDSFAGRSSLKTWLHTIAVRVWTRHRRQAASERSGDSCALASALDAALESASDPAPGPERLAEIMATREDLRIALESLPPLYREAITLFYLEEMRYREMADALGVPIGTVKSRLHNALRRLRDLLPRLPEEMV